MAGEADVDRAVQAARAPIGGDWGKTPGTARARLLHALAGAIVANRAELAELESRNVGGGYKRSGFGRELGIETLELYLETKSVIVSTGSRPINPFGL